MRIGFIVPTELESANLHKLNAHVTCAAKELVFSKDCEGKEDSISITAPEGFSYRSPSVEFDIPIRKLPALAFSCGKEFELYHKDELYYFYPESEPNQVARWALIVDLLNERQTAQPSEGGTQP